MFLVRYHDHARGPVVLSLHPRPTDVDYPDKKLFKVRPSKDGVPTIGRPVADNRPRKWVWKRYRPTVDGFENQWKVLETLETEARWLAGYAPTVEIWEDDSATGVFNKVTNATANVTPPPDLVTYTNLQWTTVVFAQVTRTTAKGGGPVVFDEAWIEFWIDDEAFDAF